MSPETLQRYFQIWFAVGVVWMFGWFLASTWYRKSQGKPILFWDVPGATFIERAASGHSNRSWYTRIGGASRCLVVAVATRRLIIRPRFPFNMLFLPEVYGLEHDVPLESVIRVVPGRHNREGLRMEFRDAHGAEQNVSLYLQKPDAFVEALRR